MPAHLQSKLLFLSFKRLETIQISNLVLMELGSYILDAEELYYLSASSNTGMITSSHINLGASSAQI